MNRLLIRPMFCSAAILILTGTAAGAKAKPQTAWALAVKGSVEVHAKASPGSKVLASLSQGALVAASEAKLSGGAQWIEVHVMAPATLEVAAGWAEASRLETLDLNRFPSDAELERIVGGPYLEDVNAKYTRIGRFLVSIGQEQPALVCYMGSVFIPQTRLQVFKLAGGQWTAGPFVEFLSPQAKTGVSEIEVRDLLGDGNECLITHEPFARTFGASGVNLVIRRIEGGKFKRLWQAPLEVSNLASFPPKINVLKPPEKNIGAPGTTATGSVEYKINGKISEPVWKGKVEFHIPGREAPLDTVSVEKVCHWNGSEFAPLQ